MRQWTIRVGDREERVGGFRDSRKARDHAERHFLSVSERWEDLGPATAPLVYRERLAGGLEEAHLVLDEAVEVYERVVQQQTQHPGAVTKWGSRLVGKERRKRVPSLLVATPGGVFCAFARRKPSGIATAFRPLPARRRGPIRAQHFCDEARRRVFREF